MSAAKFDPHVKSSTRLYRPLAIFIISCLGTGSSVYARGPALAPGEAQLLPAVTVTGARVDETWQHLGSPVDSGALGTRSNLETPFSSSAVTSAEIEERHVNKLGNAFSTDASVSDNSATYGAYASYLTVRGLALDWQNSFRIDGKPFISYVVTLPYEQFERVELLKGATGFMYGFGSPGGVVNYISKKPTNVPVRDVTLGVESKDLWRESVDLGGRLGGDARFGYRLNATHQEGTIYNNGSINRNAVSLALDARLTDRLAWEFQGIYQDMKGENTDPSIYTGLLPGHKLPSAVYSDNGRLVGDGTFFDNEFRFYSTGLKYEISPDWILSTSYSHASTRTRRNEEVLQIADESGRYHVIGSDYGEAYQFNFWQAMLQGKFQVGSIRHNIVLGTSWQSQKNDYAGNGFYKQIGAGSLSTQNTASYHSIGTINRLGLYRGAEIFQKAVFASDTVHLSDRWSILAGVRHTNYGQKAFGSDGHQTSSYDKSGVLTPTVAFMYKVAPQTMAYVSYIESLEQGASVGISYANYGAQLEPLKSRQYEIGIKSQNDRWTATVALFRIERKAEYPNADNEIVQDGLSVYQGAELGASLRLGSSWEIGADVMLLDTSYKRGADNIGNRVAGAPRLVAATQVSYRVPRVPGLKLQADAKYTGSTMLRPGNDVEIGGYTIFSIGASYDTTISGYDTTFRLAVNNLANKRHWLFQYADYIKAGDPRRVSLTATMRF